MLQNMSKRIIPFRWRLDRPRVRGGVKNLVRLILPLKILLQVGTFAAKFEPTSQSRCPSELTFGTRRGGL